MKSLSGEREKETKQRISKENYHSRLLYVFCGKMKMFNLVHFVCEVILIQINELIRSDLKLLTFIVKLH